MVRIVQSRTFHYWKATAGLLLALALLTCGTAATPGPLRKSPNQYRYFDDPGGKAVYLAALYPGNLLQDWTGTPRDWDQYMEFLERAGVNATKFVVRTRLHATPTIWERTGPGTATDGGLRVDLDKLNPVYFDLLSSRVQELETRGYYIVVMFFNGFDAKKKPNDDRWGLNPLNSLNNINGIHGDPDGNGDGWEIHQWPLPDGIQAVYEAYLRQVVDTVNPYDNVLYEVGNEVNSGSASFQRWVVDFVRDYQQNKPKQHPIGMTAISSVGNPTLFGSTADWISPDNDPVDDYINDPPANDHGLLMWTDADHIFYLEDTAEWMWKLFSRGHNPMAIHETDMDVTVPLLPSHRAIGDTLSYARRMRLDRVAPRDDLASTRYCLAWPGVEYLVFQPLAEPFTVAVEAGNYQTEWFDIQDGSTSTLPLAIASDGPYAFIAPAHLAGPAALFLTRADEDMVVAMAGKDQLITTGLTARLDGSGSHDPTPGPQPLSFLWEQTDGPEPLVIDDSDQERASVLLSAPGAYALRLTVSDGLNTDSSQTTVTAVAPSASGTFRENNGVVAMESENYTGSTSGSGTAAGSSWQPTTSLPGYSGQSALLAMPDADINAGETTAGPRLDYRVDFATTGTYYLWIRLLGPSDKDDSVHAGLDGVPATLGRLGMYNNSGTWHWEELVYKRPGNQRVTVTIPSAGVYTVNLWMREDGVAVDKLMLTTNPATVPSGTGPLESSRGGATNNAPPVAEAGDNRTVPSGLIVHLDGSASTDPDNGPQALTYDWIQTGGPPITLHDPGSAAPSFLPPSLGPYTFQMTVSDAADSATDSVTLTVATPNRFPFANAGGDQTIVLGTPVSLDASGSYDPDSGPQPLGFSWIQLDGPQVSLAAADSATPSFTAAEAGTYGFGLTITDGDRTGADNVRIEAAESVTPVANAGPDQTVPTGSLVSLDGTASFDPVSGPEPLSFSWEQLSGPAVMLDGADTATPNFTAAAAADYGFELTVGDGLDTHSDQVTISAFDNVGPTADAGPDQTVPTGATVFLDGSASYDPDNAPFPLSYSWLQTMGPTVALNNAGTDSPSFLALTADRYTFELTVDDGVDSATDQTEVTAEQGAGHFIESGGLVVAETENYSGGAPGRGEAAASSWQPTTALAGYSGQSTLVAVPNADVNVGESTDGPRLDYEIVFATPGTYYLWVRMLGSTDKDDSVHAGLNGLPATLGRLGMYDNSGAWHWEERVHKRPGETRVTVVVSTPGLHTLNLWMREDGVAVDKALLTTDASFAPSGTGPAESPRGVIRSDPEVLSILRADADPTNAATLRFTVNFSETVTGVDGSDFALTTTGSLTAAAVASVQGAGSTYTVTATTASGSGTLRLDLVDDDSIVDSSGIPLGDVGLGNGDFVGGESYTIDRIAPVVTVDPIATPDPTPALSGAVDDPAALVELTVAGQTKPAANNADGTWTLPDNALSALPDGTYDVSVMATDSAGNQGVDSTTDELVVDTASVKVLMFTPTQLGFVVVDGAPADQQALTLETNSGDAVGFSVTDDSTWLAATPSSGVTPATLAVSVDATGLSEGTYSGTITASASGHVSAVADVTLAVENSGGYSLLVSRFPDRSASTPLAGQTVSGNIYVFTSPDEGVARVSFYLDDPNRGGAPIQVERYGPFDFASSNSDGTADPYDTTVLPDGGHEITAAILLGDGSGLTLSSPFVVNNSPSPPIVSAILRASADPTNATEVSFTVRFSAAVTGVDAGDFSLFTSGEISGAAVQNVSGQSSAYTVSVYTGTGSGTLRLDQIDDDSIVDVLGVPLGGTGIGNGDYAGDETFTVDKLMPVVAVHPLTTNDNTPALTGQIDDPDAVIVVSIDVQAHAATNNGDGTWFLPDDTLAALPDGTYDVQAQATDPAGNVAYDSTTAELMVDATGPVLVGTAFDAAHSLTGVSVGLTPAPGESFALLTDRQPATEYLLQFHAGTSASEALADNLFPFFLYASSVPTADLTAYYADKPEPYKTYLQDAVDGLNPFVYLDGGTLKLVDAARYDLPPNLKTDMAVPGDYPTGNYTILGQIADPAGNVTPLAFTLVVGDSLDPPTTMMDHVVLVSVDGLRGDALTAISPDLIPNLTALAQTNATLNARTVFSHTNTLPNHVSMLTSRPVFASSGSGGHRYTDNDYPAPGVTLHNSLGEYIPGIFDVAHDHGLHTALLASKSKFVLFDNSWNAVSGAPDLTGPDDGPDKLDTFQIVDDIGLLTSEAIAELNAAAGSYPSLLVLHYRHPDTAGHASGWDLTPGSDYVLSVIQVDQSLGQIMDTIRLDPNLAGRTAVILTSDHGGIGTSHSSEPDNPANYTIPFLVWLGDTAATAGDLYAINPASRTDPAAGRPLDAPAPDQPVRNADAGNLALDLLGLNPVPASMVNNPTSLTVWLPIP